MTTNAFGSRSNPVPSVLLLDLPAAGMGEASGIRYWSWTQPIPCLSVHIKSYWKKIALLVFSLSMVLSRHKVTLESGEDHMPTKAQE